MSIPTDSREFIASLNSNQVEYLIVGAYAVAFHGHPRFTGDLDIFVRASADNASRLERVLIEFSFASLGLSAADFLNRDQIIQLGYPPNRIDLITSISGVTFEKAWPDRVPGELDGLAVNFISKRCLVQNKRASGRTQDLADVEKLEPPEPL